MVLRDRNLAADQAAVLCRRDGNFCQLPDMEKPEDWEIRECQDRPGVMEYRKILEVTQDGEYSLNISGTDLSGRKSAAEFHFTIDTIPPRLCLQWEGETGDCFRSVRKGWLEILEHNFSPESVRLTGSLFCGGKEVQIPELMGWEHNGDLHRAWFLCEEEGSYRLSAEAWDMAGNRGKPPEMSAFIEDFTSPGIKLLLTEGGKSPRAFFTDENLARDSLKISLSGEIHGKQEVRGEWKYTELGEWFLFEEFPEGREGDDWYTITASAEDIAGNRSETVVCFPVNRYGSVYEIGASGEALSGTYQKEAPEITVTEKNPAMLRAEEIQVRLIQNGASRILIPGQDYQLEYQGKTKTWKTYSYRIAPSVFREDGIYQLQFTSVDEEGHFNDSSSCLEPGSLSFGIDRTSPVIEALNLSSNMPYYEESMEAVFQISDNLLLERTEFFLNGEKTEGVMKDGKYVITLEEADYMQEVSILAADAAGNLARQQISGILITQNPLLYWFSFRLVFAGSLVLAAMMVWALWKKRGIHRNRGKGTY